MTSIKPCSCKSEYQDKLYGKGNRLFNEGVKNVTCTVCGTKKVK